MDWRRKPIDIDDDYGFRHQLEEGVRAVDTDAGVWAFLVECRGERHLWTIGGRDDWAPGESGADRHLHYTL